MERSHPDAALIDAMGGTVKVARLCEVSPQAVTQWRRAGIPRARRMYLRVLRPDLFGLGEVRRHEVAGNDA